MYIGIYNNYPTQDAKDGSLVSQNQQQSNAVGGLINTSETSGIVERLAIRCDEGYENDGDITVSTQSFSNGSYVVGNGTIKLSKGNGAGAVWSDSLTFNAVSDTNVIFYLKRLPAVSAGTVYGALRVQGNVQEVVQP